MNWYRRIQTILGAKGFNSVNQIVESYGGGVVFVKQMIVILSPSLPYITWLTDLWLMWVCNSCCLYNSHSLSIKATDEGNHSDFRNRSCYFDKHSSYQDSKDSQFWHRQSGSHTCRNGRQPGTCPQTSKDWRGFQNAEEQDCFPWNQTRQKSEISVCSKRTRQQTLLSDRSPVPAQATR